MFLRLAYNSLITHFSRCEDVVTSEQLAYNLFKPLRELTLEQRNTTSAD